MIKNFPKVFKVFQKNYNQIPLEQVGKEPYKNLIATLISSRTRDETTLAASRRLFKVAPNFNKLHKLNRKTIEQLIYPVGFYKTKAKHLKKLTKIILGRYKGRVPDTVEELTKLPGVGRKVANIVLTSSFGKPAISVDTHVHRISNLLGWVKTKAPKQTERELIKILPQKYWSRVNRLFVSIGRQFTTKKKLEEFLKKEGLI